MTGDSLSAFRWAKRAKGIYYCALRTDSENSCHSGTKIVLADVLTLAAINNLGHLESHLGFFEEARACVFQSLEIFNSLWHAGLSTDSLPYDSLAPFLFLELGILSAAPAA